MFPVLGTSFIVKGISLSAFPLSCPQSPQPFYRVAVTRPIHNGSVILSSLLPLLIAWSHFPTLSPIQVPIAENPMLSQQEQTPSLPSYFQLELGQAGFWE